MKKSPISFAVAACFGASAAADMMQNTAVAAAVPVTLIGAFSASSNGSSLSNVSSSTATWSYETTTGVVTATGLYRPQTQISPAIPGQLFTHNINNIAIGGGNAASATDYACISGSFGLAVSAELCGNYNYGANYINESTLTYGPGTASSVTIGGDDVSLGDEQSIINYDGMTASLSDDETILALSNLIPQVSGQTIKFCTDLAAGCPPVAVDDFESAGVIACAEQGSATNPIAVLDNDGGTFGGPLTVTAPAPATPGPQNGTVAVEDDQTVVYTSNVGGDPGLGLDQFQYIVANIGGEVSDPPATVTVEVVPTGFVFPPDPVVNIDPYRAAVDEDGVQAMNLVTLGVVTPGYQSNYRIVTAPTAGTAAFANPNSPVLTYTNTALLPDGVDDFIEYAVTDCNGNSDTGTVRMIIISALIDVPNVIGDTLAGATTTIEAADLTVGTVTNVTDATPAGTVIGQSPGACTACLSSGDPVELTVSDGPPPLPPAPDQIEDLIDAVDDLGLPKGLTNALTKKLEAALKKVTDGKPGNDHAAKAQLQAFINQVGAQSGKKIDPADADALIAAAQAIIDQL